MKSIKSKIFSIVLSGIITSSFIVGSLGIFWANRAVRQDSVEILDLMAQVNADGLNAMFSDVEQSSEVLSHYVSENLSNLGLLRDEESLALYIAKISNICYYIATCTSSSWRRSPSSARTWRWSA